MKSLERLILLMILRGKLNFMSTYKEIIDRTTGKPLTGVRYTEERLAQCFEPGEDGFAVLHALAHQAITKYGAAKLIQKVLRGQRVSIPIVDTTKALKPWLDDLHKSEVYGDDSDAGELE